MLTRTLVRVLEAVHLSRPARAVRRVWRSSLQLRVVTATVVLSTAVVLVVGQFLYVRISQGLLESRRQDVAREASGLISQAGSYLYGPLVTDQDGAADAIRTVLGQIKGPKEDHSRAVLMRKAASSSVPNGVPTRAIGMSERDISQTLRDEVNAADGERVKLQKGRLSGAVPDGGHPPDAIIAGSIVYVPVVGKYELYIAFRMDREQEILDVVRTTFLFGGLGLVVLVAGVAFMVTRQVVTPVKHAARTAEELSSGRFDRRMTVKGSDELSRLGRAFNDMAGSLERQIHRLESLSVVQRRFVSDVSHELRTPLTTIRMAGEMLYEARADFDPTLARSAELLQNQLDRFEELLADLLEISRFDAGAAVLELEQQDVGELVRRVVESLRPLAERSGSVLRLDVPPDGAMASFDARRVERILRNLLANAIDHGEGKPIDVEVAAGERAVAVGVRDHGVGLRPGDELLVFNRFWRADPARARQTGGTGLGLAIALEDALLHGGTLRAWGEPGRGAHFVLTLPCDGSMLEEYPIEVDRDALDPGVLEAGAPVPGEPDESRPDESRPDESRPDAPRPKALEPAESPQPAPAAAADHEPSAGPEAEQDAGSPSPLLGASSATGGGAP